MSYIAHVKGISLGQENFRIIWHDVNWCFVLLPSGSVCFLLKGRNNYEQNYYSYIIFHNSAKYLKIRHLVHGLVIVSSQRQVHGVHQLAELVVGWMKAVLLLTQNITTNSSCLNTKWSNRDPSNTSDRLEPISLVAPLKGNINAH